MREHERCELLGHMRRNRMLEESRETNRRLARAFQASDKKARYMK